MFYQLVGPVEYFLASFVFAAFGVLFWRYPQKALALTIFLLPSYLLKIRVRALSFTFLDVFLLLIIIIWLLGNWKTLERQFIKPAIVLFALVAFLGLAAVCPSADWIHSLGLFKSLIFLPLLAASIFATFLEKTGAWKNFFLQPIFCSALTVSVIAFAYKLRGAVTFDNRLAAFWQSPNQLAMYLSLGFLAGVSLLLSQKQPRPKKSLILIGLAWLLAVMSFASSWGATLAIFGSLGCLAVGKVISRNKRLLGMVFLSGYLTAGYFLLFRGEFLRPLFRGSFDSRLVIWQVAKSLIGQRPGTGFGLGAFQTNYLASQGHYPPYLEWAVPHAHNLWLDLWLNFGFLGLAFFGLLLAGLGWRLLKKIRPTESSLIFGQLFFYWLLIYGLVDEPLWRNDLVVIFWLVLAYSLMPYNWLSYWLTKKRYLLSSETNKEEAS